MKKPTATNRPIPATVIEKLAADFGKSLRTAKEWIRTGCPVSARGFDRAQVSAWIAERKGSKSKNKLDYWQMKYRQAKAQLAQIELEKARGDLVDSKIAESWAQEILRFFKTKIFDLPRRGAGEFYGKDQAEIEVSLFNFLNEIFRETYEHFLARDYPEDFQVFKATDPAHGLAPAKIPPG
jgi:hypothetical protein